MAAAQALRRRSRRCNGTMFASELMGLDRYPATTNRSSTFVTPGPAHAVRARVVALGRRSRTYPVIARNSWHGRCSKVAIVRSAPRAASLLPDREIHHDRHQDVDRRAGESPRLEVPLADSIDGLFVEPARIE